MIPHTPNPKKLRVTGGIILGSRGRRPMAFTDDEESFQFPTLSTVYASRKPYQIIGFPYRTLVTDLVTLWRIRPHASRHTDLIADAWEGEIPDGGCQFFIKDEFYPSLVASGGSFYVNGLYYSESCEIVQRDWSYTDTETRDYSFDSGTGVVSQSAIRMTRISVVYEADGVYYLSNQVAPDDGPSHTAVTFPANFVIEHPL